MSRIDTDIDETDKQLEKLRKLILFMLSKEVGDNEAFMSFQAARSILKKNGIDPRDFSYLTPLGTKSVSGKYLNGMTPEGFYYHGLKVCNEIICDSRERHKDPKTGRIIWSRSLRFKDHDGNEQTCQIPDDKFSSTSWVCRELTKHGLEIKRKSKLRDSLVDHLEEIKPRKTLAHFDHIGWDVLKPGAKEHIFITPSRTIGDKQQIAHYTPRGEPSPLISAGSFEDWKNTIGVYARDHHKAIFAISCAFTGPILYIGKVESGGFNFMGPSSRGKTTLTQLASSVWGNGTLGTASSFIKSWDLSEVGMTAAAEAHNDSLIVFDEVTTAKDPKSVARIVYSLSSGSGGHRATSAGTLRRSPKWRVVALSTGEITIAQKISEGGHVVRAGQQVRFPDIPVVDDDLGILDKLEPLTKAEAASPDNKAALIVKKFQKAAGTYYGTAGPLFVEKLLAHGFDKVAQEIRKVMTEFEREFIPFDADAQIGRVATRFAVVAAAGELAALLGIVPWPKGLAHKATGQVFERWIKARPAGIGAVEEWQYVKAVKGLLQGAGDSSSFIRVFRQPSGRGKTAPFRLKHPDSRIANRWGYRHEDRNGEPIEFYILPHVWEERFCQGFDKSLVAKKLAELGIVQTDSEGHFSVLQRMPGGFLDRLVVINVKALNEYDTSGEWQKKARAKPPTPRLARRRKPVTRKPATKRRRRRSRE